VLELSRLGDPAVTFLRTRLRPAGGPDGRRLAALLDDLNNDALAVRGRAAEELVRLGDAARPALRSALDGQPGPKARAVLQALFARPVPEDVPAERLGALRALEVLERVATPPAACSTTWPRGRRPTP
jgi:hypothetical protein